MTRKKASPVATGPRATDHHGGRAQPPDGVAIVGRSEPATSPRTAANRRGPKPTGRARREQLNLRLAAGTLERLWRIAGADHRDPSAWARLAIEAALDAAELAPDTAETVGWKAALARDVAMAARGVVLSPMRPSRSPERPWTELAAEELACTCTLETRLTGGHGPTCAVSKASQ